MTWIWDDTAYPPRRVSGFYKKEELARLILRRGTRKPLSMVPANGVIVERYYAKRAITSIGEHFTKKQRIERLYESPYIDFSPRGVDGVFDPKEVDLLVAILEDVRKRAVI